MVSVGRMVTSELRSHIARKHIAAQSEGKPINRKACEVILTE